MKLCVKCKHCENPSGPRAVGEVSMEITIDKQVFSSDSPDRGFTVKAFYLQKPNNGDALVEIYRDGQPYRRFLFPAYKVWNIAAHFTDIVDGEIEGNFSGYDLAGWAGFHIVPIVELQLAEER